jgi:hypothetical protein
MRSSDAYGKPPGEKSMEIGGVVYKKGDKVRLSPTERRTDITDSILKGKTATIETIYLDYEDNVHLAVTVDDDPGQDLRHDLGLYMYFKPDEVELMSDEL